jgi:uncharacterized protein YheU (UPF0270 family)
MLIPHHMLSLPALRAIVEEFVTRDGTDHSSEESRIESVLGELRSGQAELHFDASSATTQIVPVSDRSNDDSA